MGMGAGLMAGQGAGMQAGQGQQQAGMGAAAGGASTLAAGQCNLTQKPICDPDTQKARKRSAAQRGGAACLCDDLAASR